MNKTKKESRKKYLSNIKKIYDETITNIDDNILNSGRNFIYRTYF